MLVFSFCYLIFVPILFCIFLIVLTKSFCQLFLCIGDQGRTKRLISRETLKPSCDFLTLISHKTFSLLVVRLVLDLEFLDRVESCRHDVDNTWPGRTERFVVRFSGGKPAVTPSPSFRRTLTICGCLLATLSTVAPSRSFFNRTGT